MKTTAMARPLSERVVIKVLPEEDVSPGGIILPDNAKEKPQRGQVVAAGPGRTEHGVLVPMTVQVGDVVLFGKYSGAEVKIDGETYLIVKESEILAIL